VLISTLWQNFMSDAVSNLRSILDSKQALVCTTNKYNSDEYPSIKNLLSAKSGEWIEVSLLLIDWGFGKHANSGEEGCFRVDWVRKITIGVNGEFKIRELGKVVGNKWSKPGIKPALLKLYTRKIEAARKCWESLHLPPVESKPAVSDAEILLLFGIKEQPKPQKAKAAVAAALAANRIASTASTAPTASTCSTWSHVRILDDETPSTSQSGFPPTERSDSPLSSSTALPSAAPATSPTESAGTHRRNFASFGGQETSFSPPSYGVDMELESTLCVDSTHAAAYEREVGFLRKSTSIISAAPDSAVTTTPLHAYAGGIDESVYAHVDFAEDVTQTEDPYLTLDDFIVMSDDGPQKLRGPEGSACQTESPHSNDIDLLARRLPQPPAEPAPVSRSPKTRKRWADFSSDSDTEFEHVLDEFAAL